MYPVVWVSAALEELAAIWLRADSAQREGITAASHAIEQQLRFNPQDQGESRPGGSRVFFQTPLGVDFRVNEEQRIVTIGHVWRFRTKRG